MKWIEIQMHLLMKMFEMWTIIDEEIEMVTHIY